MGKVESSCSTSESTSDDLLGSSTSGGNQSSDIPEQPVVLSRWKS